LLAHLAAALDLLLGFGLSDKPRTHRCSPLRQTDVVQWIVTNSTDGPVDLIAHDMGTSMTTELLARDLAARLPFELHHAVITNGSGILERACLRPTQKGSARSARPHRRGVRQPPQWVLMSDDDGADIAHLLISYLDERTQNASR
jgi:pimeloyl-ACP methyl ester carboxylesterase